MKNDSPTSALLIIGNEILSGRTQDKNINFIALKLASRGIVLKQVRVVEDDQDAIIIAVNQLRKQYSYVFTTGGIGPTHDDITTNCVAKAFGVDVVKDPEAVNILGGYYKNENKELTEARLKMAEVPKGAKLIENSISGAPGYYIENVYVMAGVPKIMQAMLEHILPSLQIGHKIHSKEVECKILESEIAPILTKLQKKYPKVDIGSYPYENDGKYGVNVVLRSIYKEIVEEVYFELNGLIGQN